MTKGSQSETERRAAVEALPRARVIVLGMRTHGTSEVIAGLRSLDRKEGLEEFFPRSIEVPEREGRTVMLINDFGPQLGSPRIHTLTTGKRGFTLYECVNGVQSLLFAGTRRCDAVLWVLSAQSDVELEPASSMLDGARFLGATRAFVFVTDAESVSAERRDAIEGDARQMLELAGFDADESFAVCSSGAIRKDASDAWKPAVRALRDALDEQVPYADIDTSFAMVVEDVFDLRGRGIVVTGPVLEGVVRVGDSIELLGFRGRKPLSVNGIEMVRRTVERAQRGDHIGLFLSAQSRNEFERDELLVTPGTGAFGRVLRARAFNWVGERTATAATMSQFDRGSTAIRVRSISVDPMPNAPTAYEIEFEIDAPRPLRDGHIMWLRDATGLIGVAFIEEVLG